MAARARACAERIELRTTPELRCLVERAVDVLDGTLTDCAEASLVVAGQHIMADRGTFALCEAAAAEWEAINARPARELHGLRRLMGRPSPFDQ